MMKLLKQIFFSKESKAPLPGNVQLCIVCGIEREDCECIRCSECGDVYIYCICQPCLVCGDCGCNENCVDIEVDYISEWDS